MATAVLRFEVTDAPPELRVPARYDFAWVVFTYRGRPLGHRSFRTHEGVVDRRTLDEAAAGFITEHAGRVLEAELEARPRLARPPDPPRATIAVCTRDRPDDLARCLGSLAPALARGHEVLVVDNEAVPGTARELAGAVPGVRYTHEPLPGLSAARNRALADAEHDLICFIDDDAVAEPGWPEPMLRPFEDPVVLCTTGLTLPLELETQAQEFSQSHASHGRGYHRRVYRGARVNPLAVGPIGAGANMAVRRAVVQSVGPFDVALGPGTPTRSGDDHEFFTRVLAHGYAIVYEPDAMVWHRHRRSMRDLERMLYGYGTGVYAYLTKCVATAGELAALRIAAGWLVKDQLPALARALARRPGTLPLRLHFTELAGCAAGPWLYLRSRRAASGSP